jgi:hypothetical protein
MRCILAATEGIVLLTNSLGTRWGCVVAVEPDERIDLLYHRSKRRRAGSPGLVEAQYAMLGCMGGS